MRTMSYVCATTGESIGFEGPAYGRRCPLRGCVGRVGWAIGRFRASRCPAGGHHRRVKIGLTNWNACASCSTRTLPTPARWWSTGTAYRRYGMVEPQSIARHGRSQLTMLPDPRWRRESLNVFRMQTFEDSQWLDLPRRPAVRPGRHGRHPDRQEPTPIRQPARITIYGPHEPHDRREPARWTRACRRRPHQDRRRLRGEHRRDGRRARQPFQLFGKARRGAGLDGGEYIFQPLEPGIPADRVAQRLRLRRHRGRGRTAMDVIDGCHRPGHEPLGTVTDFTMDCAWARTRTTFTSNCPASTWARTFGDGRRHRDRRHRRQDHRHHRHAHRPVTWHGILAFKISPRTRAWTT